MSLAVVNLGLPKSGTSTLARALRRASWSCADHKVVPRTDKLDQTERYVGELIYKGLFDLGDPAAYLEGFDTVSEMSALSDTLSLWPQMDFAVIDALRRSHPNLKFVATKRDAFEMSQSMIAWSNLGDRLVARDIPGLPAGFGETTRARVDWIEGHYAHLRALFAGDDRFLELDVAAPDARAQLAAFLGRKMPWWGKRNTNPLTKEREPL